MAANTDTGLAALGDLTGVAIAVGEQSWGAGEDISSNAEVFKNDIVIPKVWLMQALSELLTTNKELRAGDFVASLSGVKLASPEEGVEFVVVKTFKKWQAFSLVKEGNKVKKVYERDYSAIMTLENANWDYEDVVDGKEIIRRQVICCYVLLKNDILNNNPQPYLLEFASSSKAAGRKLISAIKADTSKIVEINGQKMRLPAAAFVFRVTAKEEQFEEGRAFVKDITLAGYSNKEAIQMAKDVYEFVKTNEDVIETDDRDLVDVTNDNQAAHDGMGADNV